MNPVDRNGVPIAVGSRVRANWPNAVGTVTNISEGEAEPDGETGVMTATSWPQVSVHWDVPLTNDAGQVWQDEDHHIESTGWYGEGPQVCDELEVIHA